MVLVLVHEVCYITISSPAIRFRIPEFKAQVVALRDFIQRRTPVPPLYFVKRMSLQHRVSTVAAALIAFGCDNKVTPSDPVVASVQVSAARTIACATDTIRFSATARDPDGQVIAGSPYSWISTKPEVATVDGNGVVRAITGGATTIRASSGGVSQEVQLLVRSPRVNFAYKYPSLFVSDTTMVSATVTDANGLLPVDSAVTYASNNSAVAMVASNGVVSARAVGTAVISAQGACAAENTVTVVVLQPRVSVNREVTFTRNLGSRQPLYIMQPSGADLRVFPTSAQFVDGYAWSPDGSRILINSLSVNAVGRPGVFVSNADGSGETFLGDRIVSPNWSPDGTRITFHNYISGSETDIYTVRPDGSDLQRISSAPGVEANPRWSPDGRQLLYVRITPTKSELWVVAADSSDRRQIPLPMTALRPVWSPNGKHIAFDDGTGIFMVNVDGRGLRPVTPNCNSSFVCRAPVYFGAAWQPNMQRVAYVAPGYGVGQSWVDGSAHGVLSFGDYRIGTASIPQWAPDGTSMIVFSPKGTIPWSAGIAIVSLSSVEWVATTVPDGNVGYPGWRP